MRRQYHFRPGEAGLIAWDVDRLVALSKPLKPELVPIAEIRAVNEAFWGSMPRRDVAEHARLINDCDLTHPIILSTDGRVMDGMNHVLKALVQGTRNGRAARFTSS